MLRSLRPYTQAQSQGQIRPLIAWRREVWKEKSSTISLERMRKGHRKSHQHWNVFKGDTVESSERWGGEHMGFPQAHRYNLELNQIHIYIYIQHISNFCHVLSVIHLIFLPHIPISHTRPYSHAFSQFRQTGRKENQKQVGWLQ